MSSETAELRRRLKILERRIGAVEAGASGGGPHASNHENGGSDEIDVTGLSGLLADGQTPLAHKTSHQSAGTDAIKLDDLAATDDNTDLDASATKHGLMPKWTSALISALLDLISSTRGAILYRGAAAWAALNPGTDGYVLTAHGTGTDPTWEENVGGGSPSEGSGSPGEGDYNGVALYKSADLTGQNFTGAAVAVSWDAEAYDTDGWHSPSVNPTRATVPPGVSIVNAVASLRLANINTGNFVNIAILKNGSADYVGVPQMSSEVSATGNFNFSCTGIGIPCAPGDYFETFVLVETDTSVDIVAARSYFILQAAA